MLENKLLFWIPSFLKPSKLMQSQELPHKESELCLLGYSCWWYQLMGFSWLRVRVKTRRDPATETGLNKENGKGQEREEEGGRNT